VNTTEDVLVVLKRAAVVSRAHEVIVGRAAGVTAANGRSWLATDVASLPQHNIPHS